MDDDQQAQRIDAMAGGAQFTPFQEHVNKEVEQQTQYLRAELEQANWEKDQAEQNLGDMTDKFKQSQEAFLRAQQTIIDLQAQVNAHLRTPGGVHGGTPATPGTTTVQNIIQRKADDKISKLRLSNKGSIRKQDVWDFCEEVETAMQIGPVDVKSFMTTEVKDQIQFDFLMKYPTEGPWTTWADRLLIERLKEVYPKHKETLFAADTIDAVARKWHFFPGRAIEDIRAHLGLMAGLKKRIAEGSAEEEAQFIESMVKKLGNLSSDNFFDREVTVELSQFLTAMSDGGLPKTMSDYGLKALKYAEFAERAYEMARRCRWTSKGSRSRGRIQDLPAKRRKTYKEDTRGVDSPAATSDSPNDKTDVENKPPVCRGCGRGHLGRCAYTSHPDFNKSDKPWAESENGKKYAKMGIFKLPLKAPFLPGSDTTWEAPPRKRGAKGKLYDHLYNLYENNEDIPVVIATLRSESGKERQVKALLDTGAVDGSYITPQVAAWLTMEGHTPCMCRSLVCSAMKGSYCQAVTTCFDVVVTVERTKCHDNDNNINHNKNTFYEPLFAKQETVMRLKPKVIDVDYDLIIGYQDLKLHPELLRDLLDKPTITGNPQWAPEEITIRRHLLAAFRK